MKVYVVIGNNRETHEEYHEWVSGVFVDKETAELHISRQPELFAEDYAGIEELMSERILTPAERQKWIEFYTRWHWCEQPPAFTIEEHDLVGM